MFERLHKIQDALTARASAFECAAIVDLLRIQQALTPEQTRDLKFLLERVASMLSGLMR